MHFIYCTFHHDTSDDSHELFWQIFLSVCAIHTERFVSDWLNVHVHSMHHSFMLLHTFEIGVKFYVNKIYLYEA